MAEERRRPTSHEIVPQPHSPLPRKSSQSADSFRPFSEGERELVLQAVHQLEQKVLGRIGAIDETLNRHEADIRELREATLAQRESTLAVKVLSDDLRSLSGDVRAVLRRDATQEERLGAIERDLMEAGKSAGKTAGRKSGTIWALIASGVAAGLLKLLEELSK